MSDRDIIEDLDALADAVDALEAEGPSADGETLEAAAEVMEAGLDAGQEAIDSGEVPEDAEPVIVLTEGSEALREVADGDASDETVLTAIEHTRTYHEKLTIAATQALLGGTVP